jgi:hypothetical protein
MAAPDASAARTPASLSQIRTVIVHLTPFAPGCGGHSVGDRRRNRTFWQRPPVRVMRSVLSRLQREPHQVVVFEHPSGDVDLHARVEPFGDVPVASFWEGLTADEARAALLTLAATERKDAA